MSKEAMKLQEIMEQAQVFASAWSLVGGRFDGGNAMDDAEVAKNELRQMVEEALAKSHSDVKQEQSTECVGEPDDEVLGFNGWGFPIQHPFKQKHDDPVVYSKEQMKIYAEANYDAGYTTGYMDASVKAHDKKTTPVVWVHSDELDELSHCNGMSVWAENAQVHTEDSITNQLIPSGYFPLYTTPYVPTGRQQRTAAEGEDTRRAWVKPHEWRGLTDEELDDIYYCVEGGKNALETWREQARAVEAKLREKNSL